MKQLGRRTVFVLIFALLLCVGSGLFCVLYALNGSAWASSSVNQIAYAQGRLSRGTIYDRNGVLLYDCASRAYGEGALLRRSTLHLVGDLQGNIATGARRLFADQLTGYDPVTGLNGRGNSLYLTVDSELNKAAYEALDGRAGTVAVYNYETGELLCLVTAPSYDPTNEGEITAVAEGDSRYAGAYMNRFLSSTYTPGSTFKIVTAAAALERLDTAGFSFECTGSLEVGGGTVTCPSVHGTLDFDAALAKSCNCAYAWLALQLGGGTLEDYARKAGLLDSVEISGFESAAGRFDAAEEGTLNLGWSGVGQYNDLVCPAAMLTLMGCVAGDGEAVTPRLLHRVTGLGGLPAGLILTETSSIGWDAATCRELRRMLRNDVTATYGQDQFGDLAVCAKSGTAEVGSGVKPHSWFVGFIDDSAHPYAFVVLVENGGWGSSVAGSIAAQILNLACEEG